MAKKLSTKTWLQRALDRGETRKSLAQKLGRSTSTIGDILRGRRPGENLRLAARDLGQGKRKPISPPPSKGRPEKAPPRPKEREITPIQRAEGKLIALDRAGIDKVVINVTNKETGRSFTLGAHGGINIDTIQNYSGGLGGFIAAQADAQGYEDLDDDPGYDYMYEYDMEEF